MSSVLAVTLPFFALIACGWLARASGLIGESAPKALNDFVLNFALPALLVRTIAALPLSAMLDLRFLAGWAVLTLAMLGATALAAGLVFRQPVGAALMQGFAAAHGNVGYLGITLVIGVLGPAAAAPVSMAIILDMLLLVPLVIAVTEFLARRGGSPLRALAAALRAAVANPFVLSIAAGLALSAVGADLPQVADDFLRVLGAAAIPSALFAIGVTLYGQPLRAAGPELAAIAVLKLVAFPVAAAFVLSDLFGAAKELVAAGVLLAALPVANNVFVIATRYEARPGIVSGAILVSTAASLVTFNLWAALATGG